MVSGEALERFAQMTNWDYYEAVRRFQRVLQVRRDVGMDRKWMATKLLVFVLSFQGHARTRIARTLMDSLLFGPASKLTCIRCCALQVAGVNNAMKAKGVKGCIVSLIPA